MTFFLEINFTAMLSYVYPSDMVIITLKFLLKWAAKICGPFKWATAQKKVEKHWVRDTARTAVHVRVVN